MLERLAIPFALAAPAAVETEAEEKEDVMDPRRRPLRGNQVAIDVGGGKLGGRSVGQTFVVNGRVTYYPIRQLGIGAVYGFSRGIGGISTAAGQWVHSVHGQLELPLISALRVSRRHTLAMDLFGEGGAGAIHIARKWEALGVIGGGVRLYPSRVRWLAVRIDALTYLHNTRRETGKAFDVDIAFTLGLTVLLPRRF